MARNVASTQRMELNVQGYLPIWEKWSSGELEYSNLGVRKKGKLKVLGLGCKEHRETFKKN